MLIVNSEGNSSVVVTLYELCSNQINPYFTWNLFRKGSNDSITFTSDDTSTSPFYWNQFTLTVATSSVGLTNGVIPLTPGEWEYNVYEMSNKYDLNISNAIGLVETGLMVCGLSYSSPVSIINPIPTIPVYRPS